jgi:hypothetical protein
MSGRNRVPPGEASAASPSLAHVPVWLSIVFGIFGVVGVFVAVAGELRTT